MLRTFFVDTTALSVTPEAVLALPLIIVDFKFSDTDIGEVVLISSFLFNSGAVLIVSGLWLTSNEGTKQLRGVIAVDLVEPL